MQELERLVSELSWLKRLASALVRDEGDAHDLVQETWLVAAEHAPTDGRPLKPWLSRVALNLVANGRVTGRLVDKAGTPLSGIRVVLIPDQPPGQLHIEIHEQPPTTGPDGRFQVEGAPGTRTLAILGNTTTAKRGLAIAAGATIDVGDVTVEERPK